MLDFPWPREYLEIIRDDCTDVLFARLPVHPSSQRAFNRSQFPRGSVDQSPYFTDKEKEAGGMREWSSWWLVSAVGSLISTQHLVVQFQIVFKSHRFKVHSGSGWESREEEAAGREKCLCLTIVRFTWMLLSVQEWMNGIFTLKEGQKMH